jgi:outer membrane protein assembly factor BamB
MCKLMFCLLFVSSWLTAAAEVQVPSNPLEAVKQHSGLCLLLGAGSAGHEKSITELAQGKMRVFGVALNDEDLSRARKELEQAQLCHQASADTLSFKPLPIVRDLANVVVIDEPEKLGAAGLSEQEVERITAPFGAIYTRAKDGWIVRTKERPKTMDDWTHPLHGPDNNSVSNDAELKPPLGLRWVAGVAKNVNAWAGSASTRAMVIAGPRVYTLGANEIENVGILPDKSSSETYLTARDAFNGLPLWTVDCETTCPEAILWQNAYPLATNGTLVYAAGNKKVLAVDGESGKVAFEAPTKFLINRLVLLDGVMVAGCWEAATHQKDNFTMLPQSMNGSIEAFDANSGKPLWSAPGAPFLMLAAGKTCYAQFQNCTGEGQAHFTAFDLHSGKELWTHPFTDFGEKANVSLDVAAQDFVIIQQEGKPRTMHVLAATDGHTLWKQDAYANWSAVVDGLIWNNHNKGKQEPLTGAVKGPMPTYLGARGCQIHTIVAGQYMLGGSIGHLGSKERSVFPEGGVRSPCIQSMTPANGLLYLTQNNCRCVPGALFGMITLGNHGDWPTTADYEKPRAVEKGPAFGTALEEKVPEWPTYRANPERSSSCSAQLPLEGLRELWNSSPPHPAGKSLARAYEERLASPISAPVVADGKVFVSAVENNQLLAYDAADGKVVWTVSLSSRMETPPTFNCGLLIGGCNDGYVCAWRAKDGMLVWRTRAAPDDRRIVAYGQVESLWPAIGSVVVFDNIVFTTAGRTSNSDGGVALIALDPATGETKWAHCIGPEAKRLNDMLSVHDSEIAWHYMRFDPKTGKQTVPEKMPNDKDYGGGAGKYEGSITDALWTVLRNRRSCNAYDLGDAFKLGQKDSNILAWNNKIVAKSSGATLRENGTQGFVLPSPQGNLVEAIAICGNAAVYAGRIGDVAKKKATGFVWIVSLADGKKTQVLPLPGPAVMDGIAVAGDKIYVTSWDGTLRCFGK